MWWSVYTVICLLTSVIEGTGQSVEVNTHYGILRGIRTTVGHDSYVDTYYSIPYAKPPVGDLRWRKPVVNEAWTGIRDATTPGPMCPQVPYSWDDSNFYRGQEDCLYLNVHAPKVSRDNGRLPVMVWIPGGFRETGRGDMYNGTYLASKGVVVVTINYRLGALGFLSTEDANVVGNYGLWDQIRALQWVRDVISAFNGKPNDVTIFGESAGSSRTSLLILSRESAGLFSKAIMESGVSLDPRALSLPVRVQPRPRPKQQTIQLATFVGCDARDTTRMVACLRTKDPRSFIEATVQYPEPEDFRPVVEATFGQSGLFSALPDVILKNGEFNNVTVIRGFNKDEMGIVLDYAGDSFTMGIFLSQTRAFVDDVIKERIPLDADRIYDLVVDTYVTKPNITDPKQLRAVYIQMLSEFFIIAPVYEEQKLYFNADGKREYLYRFSYTSPNSLQYKEVVYGSELPYVFGLPVTDERLERAGEIVSNWTDQDRDVSEQIMTLWTNFAKYGDPTPDGSGVTRWLPWTQATPRYLDLGAQFTMATAHDTPGIRLWNDVIPDLIAAAGAEIIG